MMSKTALKAHAEWKVPGHPWGGCKRGRKGAGWDLSSRQAAEEDGLEVTGSPGGTVLLSHTGCRISWPTGPSRVILWGLRWMYGSDVCILSPETKNTVPMLGKHALQHCLSCQHLNTASVDGARRAWRGAGFSVQGKWLHVFMGFSTKN